jgi:hypothetical protein
MDERCGPKDSILGANQRNDPTYLRRLDQVTYSRSSAHYCKEKTPSIHSFREEQPETLARALRGGNRDGLLCIFVPNDCHTTHLRTAHCRL